MFSYFHDNMHGGVWLDKIMTLWYAMVIPWEVIMMK
jgi:hypothetical protein